MSPNPDALRAALREHGRAVGLDAVGFATAEPFARDRAILEERQARGLHGGMHFTYGNPARATDPGRTGAGARSLVVGARSYRRQTPRQPESGGGGAGAVARYSRRDEYKPLRAGLESLAGQLRDAGYQAVALADDNRLVDRAAAHRAGLGWYGKNSLILLPDHGSWFVLGSVITDADLGPSPDPVADGCGPCTRCLSACPTGALVAPGVLDARRCLAWLLEAKGDFPLEYRRALGGRIYGCDDCQDVCPPNRVLDRRDPPPPPDDGEQAWVDLVDILLADDETLLDRFGRWYVPQRQARYIRRNALIALGNTGDGGQPRVEAALTAALAGADPLVRSHAVWAAHQLGRDDLLAGLGAAEEDPAVRLELATAGFDGTGGSGAASVTP